MATCANTDAVLRWAATVRKPIARGIALVLWVDGKMGNWDWEDARPTVWWQGTSKPVVTVTRRVDHVPVKLQCSKKRTGNDP